MQKPLNTSSLITSLIAPLILAVATISFLFIKANDLSWTAIGISCVALIWSGLWLYAAVNNTYHSYYDDKHIYLKGWLQQHEVPLTHVTALRLTNDKLRIMGMTLRRYIIEFNPETGISDQYVNVAPGETDLDEFAEVLGAANTSVVIRHTT